MQISSASLGPQGSVSTPPHSTIPLLKELPSMPPLECACMAAWGKDSSVCLCAQAFITGAGQACAQHYDGCLCYCLSWHQLWLSVLSFSAASLGVDFLQL